MSTHVVTVESIRIRLGLPEPLDSATSARIEDSIASAEARVLSFLNRESLEAVEVTLQGLTADPLWPTTDKRAWPQAKAHFADRFRVLSHEANADNADLFDVTFLVGLDVAGDPELAPIRAFIKEDVVAVLIADPLFAAVSRPVSSVSADGQSVTYTSPPGDAGAAGAGLSLASLRRWRRLSIGQPPATRLAPWPYRRDRAW